MMSEATKMMSEATEMTKRVILEQTLALENLSNFAAQILKIAKEKNANIILLNGNLSSGKTTLIQHIARILGYTDSVTSPTFSLQNIYPTSPAIFHYDLYQKTLSDALNLGLLDMLSEDGIHIIEWPPEQLKNILEDSNFNTISINITSSSAQNRAYKVAL